MAPRQPEITQPVRVDEDALVKNVYTGPGGGVDNKSQNDFSQYEVDRMYGTEDEVAKTYVPGDEKPGTKRIRDGWRLTPKQALGVFVAINLVAQAAVNGESIVGKAGETGGDIINLISPKTKQLASTSRRQKKVTSTQRYPIDTEGEEQRSGIAQADTLSARGLVRRLKAIKRGGKIERIVITGNASDEYTQDGVKSIGRHDGDNQALALKRAEKFSASVRQVAKKEGVTVPAIVTDSKEHVLDREQLGTLLADVQQSKYGSVLSAITAYNNGDKTMPDNLRSEIKRLIGSQRKGVAAVEVSQIVSVPGKTVEIPGRKEKVKRKDTKHPIIPFIIPLPPPIPRYRRIKNDPFEKPPTVNEEPLDKVWIELYEEALQRNGELVADAWSLTRKYQVLYREERITQGLRYDYKDDKGKDQSIDVLFIDRPELDTDTIDAVSGLLFELSMLQGGRVGDKLDTIAIFPSENTGPQRPDKIGLGIDEQLGKTTLGVAIPVIGLVEIQMPKNPTKSDIERFNGLRWVIAHEAGGHFTDVNNQSRRIDNVNSNRPGRTFTARNPWVGAGDDGYATTGRRHTVGVKQFTIPHPAKSTDEYIVNPGSVELQQAETARLRGQAPTNYGDTEAPELYAETAAAVITGIPIPPSEAGVSQSQLGKKPGYFVDAGLQHRFVTRVGAVANIDTLAWPAKQLDARRASFSVTLLAGTVQLHSDKDQNRTSENAKNQPYQPDHKRLKILARARR